MRIHEEGGDEMRTREHPCDVTSLTNLTPVPEYGTARDLLGVIIAWYSAKIGDLRQREIADWQLKEYTALRDQYVKERDELHVHGRNALMEKIRQYKSLNERLTSS